MISYREILDKVVQHMYDRNAEAFWYLSTENGRQMKAVYTQHKNMQDFIEWLEYMADNQEAGVSSGSVGLSIGGSC
jgi:hypothetical protein